MKKGTATKVRKPRAKGQPTHLILSERMGEGETLEELEEKAHKLIETQPIVCQFCGGKGYIELDKVGLEIMPCYNCDKGKEQLRMLGVPEDVIARGMPDVSDNRTESVDSGTQQPDNSTGSRDSSQPE